MAWVVHHTSAMRLAVLYDARVHLPAFHALKAWRLAVMASSTFLFHHQVSRPHRWGFDVPNASCCLQQTCLEFRPDFLSSSSRFSFHSGHMCLEDFLESATSLMIHNFGCGMNLLLIWAAYQSSCRTQGADAGLLMLQSSNLLSRNHLHIHNKFAQALSK